jgi:hypothetical protein
MINGDKKTAQGIIQNSFDCLLKNNKSAGDFDVAIEKVSLIVTVS